MAIRFVLQTPRKQHPLKLNLGVRATSLQPAAPVFMRTAGELQGRLSKAPEHWPEAIGRYWLQAKRNIKDENWDAAAVMARSALQLSLRDQGAVGRTLQAEIDDLANKGVLPAVMRDWAHEVRALGNDSAHPAPSQGPTDPQDARDIVQFLDFFLEYSYSLPKKINDYRARRSTA